MEVTAETSTFWDWAKTIRASQSLLEDTLEEPFSLSFNELSDAANLDFIDLGVKISVNRVAERHYSFFLNRWFRKLFRIPPKKTQLDPEMFQETVEVAFNAYMEENFGE